MSKNRWTFLLILLFFINILYSQDSFKLIPFLKGDLFGFVNENKKLIIEPSFNFAYPFGYSYNKNFYPEFALVQIKDIMFLVNEEGSLIEEEKFKDKVDCNEISPIQSIKLKVQEVRYNIFEKNGKKGIICDNNKIIINPIYDELDIYYFSEAYFDDNFKKYNYPTYINVTLGNKKKIIRIDEYKEFENVSLASFEPNSNYMIVWLNNEYKLNGMIFNDNLILIDEKYFRIQKFYENQGLLSVTKVIKNHPVSIYIDLKGNEFYEE